MGTVSRFRQAEEDLLMIAEYIARDNPEAAIKWLDRIEQTLALVAEHPLLGQAVDDIRPGLRRISQGNYLLYYELRKNGIVLVRVLLTPADCVAGALSARNGARHRPYHK